MPDLFSPLSPILNDLHPLSHSEHRMLAHVTGRGLQFDRRWGALAAKCDAVCFGTLAQRSAVSREAIDRFLLNTTSELKLFDIFHDLLSNCPSFRQHSLCNVFPHFVA